MVRYYDIAGCTIAIYCEDSDIIDGLSGFDIFRSDNLSVADVYILLLSSVPKVCKNELYYKVSGVSAGIAADSLYYKTPNGIVLQIVENKTVVLSLSYLSKSKQITIEGDLKHDSLRYALWMGYSIAALSPGISSIAVHASAVLYKGMAYLFTGESGTGKSTHTALICRCFKGAELLNDDSPIVHIEGDNCMVYGSPWSGKTACYKKIKAPLGGIVRLKQAGSNDITLLDGMAAVTALLPSFPPELYLIKEWMYGGVMPILSFIAANYPLYRLECLPDEEAARLSVGTICKS